MLRRLRRARGSHVLLGLAVLLTIGAAFGMHPEPGGASPALPDDGISKTRDATSSLACLACLTHGAVLAPRFSGLHLAAAPAGPAPLVLETLLAGRLAGRDLSGRSPPVRA
ncbi:MAG TPA: hypothetical protein VMQ61_07965 [Thermoanaerobaculia bacterium]|nr:hypothetical protein [Thermoanaerobaculia bacterium]